MFGDHGVFPVWSSLGTSWTGWLRVTIPDRHLLLSWTTPLAGCSRAEDCTAGVLIQSAWTSPSSVLKLLRTCHRPACQILSNACWKSKKLQDRLRWCCRCFSVMTQLLTLKICATVLCRAYLYIHVMCNREHWLFFFFFSKVRSVFMQSCECPLAVHLLQHSFKANTVILMATETVLWIWVFDTHNQNIKKWPRASHIIITIIITNPLTARVAGAPQILRGKKKYRKKDKKFERKQMSFFYSFLVYIICVYRNCSNYRGIATQKKQTKWEWYWKNWTEARTHGPERQLIYRRCLFSLQLTQRGLAGWTLNI